MPDTRSSPRRSGPRQSDLFGDSPPPRTGVLRQSRELHERGMIAARLMADAFLAESRAAGVMPWEGKHASDQIARCFLCSGWFEQEVRTRDSREFVRELRRLGVPTQTLLSHYE